MKYLAYTIALVMIYSCGSDNIDLTSEEALPLDPVEIEIVDNILYGRVSETPTVAPGMGYIVNDGYLVASDGVDVACPGSLATTWNGGDHFFHILFYKAGDEFFLVHAFYQTEVDGQTRTVNNIIDWECRSTEERGIEVEEVDGRLRGTFTDEFFYINPDWVGPFVGCDPFISVGVLEASFDVEIVCQ